MIIGYKLSKDDKSPKENQTLHKSIIESLLCVIVSRLDIMQVVNMVECFQATPKETHVGSIKIIFKYLKETLRLWFLVSKK